MHLPSAILWTVVLLSTTHAGFLRRIPCSLQDSAAIKHLFKPDSLRGSVLAHDGTVTLSLRVSGDYASNNCDALGGAAARLEVDAHVLGRSISAEPLEDMGLCPEHSPAEYPRSDPLTYAIYNTSFALEHAYRMHTLATTIRLRLNDSDISCFSADITPYIGDPASMALKAVPFAVTVLTGLVSSLLKTVWSRARSNFRYEIADAPNDPAESYFPGVGECLQYIQFVFFMGCLTLSYPGFFRSSTSQLAWSSLIFKNWPITHEFVYPGVQDGIYAVNATTGLEEMAQYLGATMMSDVWTNAVVNLALIVAGTLVSIHLLWLGKWAWQSIRLRRLVPMLDPRANPLPYIQRVGWSVARVVIDYFLFPVVAISLNQSLMARWFPVYRTFLAVAFVAVLAASLGFIVHHLIKGNRQTRFFHKASFPLRSSDDWISSCLYGIPFLRGIAVGALQNSGMGQIIVLAACEFYILACMVYNRQSEGAGRHIVLSSARLLTVALSFTYLPSISAGEEAKAVVGYLILSIHTAILCAGFIVDCVYEMVVLILFKLGVLDPGAMVDSHGPQQAPIFGIGQLSRRSARRISFARLPALTPADNHLSYLAETTASRQSSYLGDPPHKTDHTSFLRSSRSDTPSIRSTTDSIASAIRLDPVPLDDLELYGNNRGQVDYSVRESDQYYTRSSAMPVVRSEDHISPNNSEGFLNRITGWRRWLRKPKRTSGFEVIRPSGARLPDSQGSGSPGST